MLQECFTAPSLATSSVTTAHKKLERSVKPARKGYSWKERDGDMNSHPYLQHSRRDASSSSHAASPNTTPGGCPRDPERQPSHNQLASSSSSSTASAAGSTSGNASETQTTLGRGETSGSVSSSASSSSLQRRVSSEAQEAALVATVHSLQQAALALREGISGGTVDTDHVQSTLNKMLQEHAHLATTVATVASSLEVVNKQSRGRAAKHIASSHNSLGSELCLLAQHLRALEEALQDESCHLRTSSPLPPHITSHTAQTRANEAQPLSDHTRGSELGEGASSFISMTDNGGVSPHIMAGSCISIKSDVDRGSPRLPEIYLTPSLPPHSAVSPVSFQPSFSHSPPSVSPSPQPPLTSPGPQPPLSPPSPSPQPSLSSSLSHVDPCTPDSSTAPIIHSDILHTPELPDSGVPDTYSGAPDAYSAVPDKAEMGTHKRHASKKDVPTSSAPILKDFPPQQLDRDMTSRLVGSGNSHTNSSVLEWLLSSRESFPDDHSSHEDHGESVARDETDCLRDTSPFGCDGAVSADDGRGIQATPLSERAAAESPTGVSSVGALGSPPPVSSPCADSGISGSHHSSLPPTSHTHLHSSLPTSHSHLHTLQQPSPSPPAITLSDIEDLREELSRLRDEILDTSRWSHTLPSDRDPAPSRWSHTLPSDRDPAPSRWNHTLPSDRDPAHTHRPITASYSTSELPGPLHSNTPPVSTPYHIDGVSTPFFTPTEFTPAVSRPYQSVSKPFNPSSTTPTNHRSFLSTSAHLSHRRLFPKTGDSILRNRGDSILRDHQNSVERSFVSRQPRVVSHATQTAPPLAPHSSTKTWDTGNRTGSPSTCPYSLTSHLYSPAASTLSPASHSLPLHTSHPHHPSLPLHTSLPHHPSLPVGFTPHLIVHTVHSPSHPPRAPFSPSQPSLTIGGHYTSNHTNWLPYQHTSQHPSRPHPFRP